VVITAVVLERRRKSKIYIGIIYKILGKLN